MSSLSHPPKIIFKNLIYLVIGGVQKQQRPSDPIDEKPRTDEADESG